MKGSERIQLSKTRGQDASRMAGYGGQSPHPCYPVGIARLFARVPPVADTVITCSGSARGGCSFQRRSRLLCFVPRTINISTLPPLASDGAKEINAVGSIQCGRELQWGGLTHCPRLLYGTVGARVQESAGNCRNAVCCAAAGAR
jgi:hypothetical protein